MTIRSAGDDDGRPWYAIRDYPERVRGVAIEISIDGAHVVGHLGIDRGSAKLAWMTHVCGVEAILVPWRHPLVSADATPRRYPSAWRPSGAVPFPHSLPAPLPAPVSLLAIACDAAAPPPTEADGWPYPHVPLGLGAPASVDECEARVLRGLRTLEAGPRVGHAARQMSGDFSREWLIVLRRYQYAAGEAEIDRGHIGPVRALFVPTRRDLADASAAVGWLLATRDNAMIHVWRLRAADPAWSFAQIAEGSRGHWRSRQAVQAAYRTSCIALFNSQRKTSP